MKFSELENILENKSLNDTVSIYIDACSLLEDFMNQIQKDNFETIKKWLSSDISTDELKEVYIDRKFTFTTKAALNEDIYNENIENYKNLLSHFIDIIYNLIVQTIKGTYKYISSFFNNVSCCLGLYDKSIINFQDDDLKYYTSGKIISGYYDDIVIKKVLDFTNKS